LLVETFLHNDQPLNLEQLTGIFKKIERQTNLKLSFISRQGRVMIGSSLNSTPYLNVAQLFQNNTRKNIIFLSRSGNIFATKYVYFLKRQALLNGKLNGFLQLGIPVKPYLELTYLLKSRWFLTWLIFFLSYLGLLVCYLDRAFTGFKQELKQGLAGLGEGNFGQKAFIESVKEFKDVERLINNTIEKVKMLFDTVSKEKIEVEAILNGIDAGVAALDREGKIIQTNKAFEMIFPYVKEYTGSSILEVSLDKTLHNICQKALQDKQTVKNLEIQVENNFYNVNIIVPKRAQEIGAILVLHNISSLKKVEKIRKDFVANASHELRTPLTSIRGYAETLVENEELLQDKGKDILKIILKNAEQMHAILEDILKLARIESGKESRSLGCSK